MLTEFGLKIAPSTYYAALTRRPSRRAVRDEELKTMIVKIYEENYSVYGAKKSVASAAPEWCAGRPLPGGAADA